MDTLVRVNVIDVGLPTDNIHLNLPTMLRTAYSNSWWFLSKSYTRRPIPQTDPHGNVTLWRRRTCGKYVNWKMATFLFHDHDIVSDKNNWIRALVDHIQHFKDPRATFWDCSWESHQGVVMTEGLSWWSYNSTVKKTSNITTTEFETSSWARYINFQTDLDDVGRHDHWRTQIKLLI